MAARDYYEILGVPRSASADDIRSAHRTLVKKWHPDRNKSNPQAATRFAEIQSAYDVLSDPDKRTKYDQWGPDFEKIEAAEKQGYGPSGGYGGPFGPGSRGPGRSARSRPSPQDFNPGGGGGAAGGVDFSDLFGSMFGGGKRPSQRPAGGMPMDDDDEDLDVVRQVSIPFRRAMRGTTLSLDVGTAGQSETVEVKIPAGVTSGQRIRLKGKGNAPSPRSKVRGDLFLVINVADDAIFERSGNDLLVNVSVDLYTALLGGKVDVQTLDGSVTLTLPPGTSSGQKLRAAGMGIPTADKSSAGDLFAVIKVVLPKHLSDEAKSLVERLKSLAPVSDR
jgi:curved DNA-binding protein